MPLIATTLLVIVALLHLYFMVLEMLLWTRPLGLKVFRNTPAQAQATRVLAANQGLYNGFLVAGLAWAALSSRTEIALFFLGCVAVAGVFGALTVSCKIFVVQGLPALLGIAAVLLHI